MTLLLVIEASPRHEHSASRILTAQFVEKWARSHPNGSVVVRDLVQSNLQFVDLPWIGAAFTPPEQHSPEHASALKTSTTLIEELKAADHIVIGTPMYNFSIPALLKAYIDQIVRVGVTVSTAYEGMLKNKKATVILTTGGDFSPGAPFASANVASSYLKQILGFIGISDVDIVLAVKTLTIDQGETTLANFASQFDAELSAAAA
ncbi:FMN-dependent NADH-azoreductase [Bradyrhizobium sp. LTSPM299]|uniref:FMN-dependent NADH-azoreductase n=1 Tax=Bradyrhizobium sp. LTSPM299 TaxID=1619233 RepID=UPI0005C8311A|nr:NAD(P)H-dependent oxidoreductase [Bradyrhizobium sp. LTSPM299]KJC60320.1 FMN-dependent NADH-azoreductase [Bradyrhizobium sp. LTSPM299]